MYRNRFTNGGSQTQTTTSLPNIPVSTSQSDISDKILFYIVTGNHVELRKLINSTNINNVIDIKNNYTALHYAVKLPNNNIVEYLMSCGANPDIKQNEGKDAVDLSIESNKRYLIDIVLKKNNAEIDQLYSKFDDIHYKNKTLERTNAELKEKNEWLNKSSDQYVNKIDMLKEENVKLKDDNVKLKRKIDDGEKAFANLLKKVQKN